jgi:hypothetical protein
MRVALKKMLVFSLKASSFSGSVERSVVIGPSCRQATEKFDGSSLRPSGCPHPPFRACEMKQVTPGTLGSSKLLTQTLSLGEVNLKVVLTQARSSARARLDAARSSIADRKSGLIRLSNGRPALRLVNIKAGRIRGGASKAR